MADTDTNLLPQNSSNELISGQKPAKKAKTNKRLLEKAFPAEYIKQGLNGTRAYKALRPKTKLSNAREYASTLIAKPNVIKAIEALLPSEEETMAVLKDVYATEREDNISYKDLHKFWETDLKLRGKLKEGNTNNVQVNMVVDNTTTHAKQ